MARISFSKSDVYPPSVGSLKPTRIQKNKCSSKQILKRLTRKPRTRLRNPSLADGKGPVPHSDAILQPGSRLRYANDHPDRDHSVFAASKCHRSTHDARIFPPPLKNIPLVLKCYVSPPCSQPSYSESNSGYTVPHEPRNFASRQPLHFGHLDAYPFSSMDW